MAFGNLTTLYIPTAANAGSSQWGTDVRKLLSSADSGTDATTTTQHGTDGGNTTRTFDPYTASTTDTTDSLFGWAVAPSDMNSVSGARRFFPSGNHTATVQMVHDGLLAYSGLFYMYVYRVGPSPGRTRTLLGSASNTVALPVLSGEWTATVTVALGEVILDVDETIQYSFEFNVNNVFLSGHLITFYCGTRSSVVSRIDTPGLKTLADTTGSASGSGAASGTGGKVLGTNGSASGSASAAGVMGATAGTTGTASGTATATGIGGSVAGTVGTATGSATATGLASIVLGTVGTVQIGAPTSQDPDYPVINPTRQIAGVVIHHETGDPVDGATLTLFRDSDDFRCTTTTSAPDGSYSFVRDEDDPYTYFVMAEFDTGTPVHGVTDRGLIPEVI